MLWRGWKTRKKKEKRTPNIKGTCVLLSVGFERRTDRQWPAQGDDRQGLGQCRGASQWTSPCIPPARPIPNGIACGGAADESSNEKYRLFVRQKSFDAGLKKVFFLYSIHWTKPLPLLGWCFYPFQTK